MTDSSYESMMNAAQAELSRLRDAAKRDASDQANTHTAIQELCLSAGIARIAVLGDGHGVPGIEELAGLLAAELARLRSLMADAGICQTCGLMLNVEGTGGCKCPGERR